ncbi:MAG TPA: Crp/Fnr family transcriptional regulator [Dongiaceae bacterium]|nr:Crp/Fnr family transcriptional regulator [Dongiaceae bacterium]
MPTVNPMPVANELIDALPRRERSRILSCCTLLNLEFGEVLCEQNGVFSHVYFPLTGFISLVTSLRDHPPLEVGMIGNEGMLGATLALRTTTAPVRALVQGAGTALRMSAPDFLREMDSGAGLKRVLCQYLFVLMAQVSQSAACVHFHEIEPRLARWLLMTHDRAHSDNFYLTHEFLAGMLGVRRSGITIAAGALQTKKLIRYSRGEIRILDRKGLEAVSCECYGAGVNMYTRSLVEMRSH